jgi:hypothetical protein
MPRVSVAMCTFNGAAFLKEQLESMLAQSRPPDELIVCDDASSDATHEILRAFRNCSGFPVHIHVNAERIGATGNFEKAISLCSGDLIFLADQDDIWREDKVAKMLAAFSEFGEAAGLVFTDGDVVESSGISRGYTLWESFGFRPEEQRLVKQGRALDVLIRHNVVTGATTAFRAEYRAFITPFPDVGIHDAWIALLIASIAGLHAIGEPLIKYRHHGSNQIGAAKRTGSHMIHHALRTGAQVYEDQSEQARLAALRLARWSHSLSLEHAKKQLMGRADFTSFRAGLPRNRLARLPKVLSRLFTGEYVKYASGLRSAAGDLVRRE